MVGAAGLAGGGAAGSAGAGATGAPPVPADAAAGGRGADSLQQASARMAARSSHERRTIRPTSV
jgi:hypothetical protein